VGNDFSAIKGYIFDIQRYSINDGPGIRTTVFLKECPLRCLWCDNPESQEIRPELFYFKSLCVKCLRCIKVCPVGANKITNDSNIEIDRELCKVCGACVEACLDEARAISGRLISVEEVIEIVKKDALFYRNSGGGITLSGGEPCCQPLFAINLLEQSHQCGFHTTLDTTGYAPWEVFESIVRHADLVLYDIKHVDPQRHKELTGVDNKLILDNLKRIILQKIQVIVRVPLIPGLNDSDDNIRRLGEFVVDLDSRIEVDLLPYHPLGTSKYSRLGREYMLSGTVQFREEEVEKIQQRLKSYGLNVVIA